jgi:hypothetical protein
MHLRNEVLFSFRHFGLHAFLQDPETYKKALSNLAGLIIMAFKAKLTFKQLF